MIETKEITLRLPTGWWWSFLIWGIALVLILAFAPLPASRSSLGFAVGVLGGTGALIVAINALGWRTDQLQYGVAQSQQAEQQFQQLKVKTALDFIFRWNDPQFTSINRSVNQILMDLKNLQTIDQQKDYFTKDLDRLAILVAALNFIESLSIAIQRGVADEDTTNQFFRSIVINYWQDAESFIKNRRVIRSNPRLFSEIEWLFDQWR